MAWLERCAEDRAALEPTGAQVLHLSFLDAPYRTGADPRAALTQVLDELVQGFEEVWIPAAIGGHRDHVLLAEVALRVSGDRRRRLYADQPYAALSRGWSALVDAGRRGRHDDTSLRTQLDASPFLPSSTVPVVSELSAEQQAEKRRALHAYQSQLPPLIAAFGRWFDDPTTARFEVAWDPGPGPRPGRPIDLLVPCVPIRPAVRANPDDGPAGSAGPIFLTVLVRTVGNRPDALAAALDSLAGQTCTDFEVILLHHLPTPTGSGAVAPPWDPSSTLPGVLIGRTRIVDVVGGCRAAPLNAGVDLAAGSHVAILDDDDLALEDWVDTFRVMAGRHPETVLRARVGADHLEGGGWPRAQDPPAESFDLIEHLNGNASPGCGVAFPRECFTEFGLRFDESLAAGEDWDLLLQAAAVCGVTASPKITSVHRRGNGDDDSLARRGGPAREDILRAVIARADRRPLLLPPGTVSRLRADHAALVSVQQRAAAAEQQCQALTAALAQQRHERQELIDTHERERASTRAQHAQELADRAEQITREFHASTSWRISAPLRAAGSLRLRLTGKRRPRPPTGADPDPGAPTAGEPTQPTERTFLKPPPDPGIVTWPARQFEDLYASHPDPWGYTTSWYEHRKYAITIACLPQERYRRVFEPGCSIGVLSEHLAGRADALVCADFAAGALVHARRRLARYSGVDVRQLFLPGDWPDGQFDLIVISEMATYLSDEDLNTLVQRTTTSLEDHGHLILVHFRPATGTPHTAAEVHHRFRDHPNLKHIGNHEESEFLLDILQREP